MFMHAHDVCSSKHISLSLFSNFAIEKTSFASITGLRITFGTHMEALGTMGR